MEPSIRTFPRWATPCWILLGVLLTKSDLRADDIDNRLDYHVSQEATAGQIRQEFVNWRAVLNSAKNHRVYVEGSSGNSAILDVPVKQRRSISGGPSFLVWLPNHSLRLNALTLDPSGATWGDRLQIRDALSGEIFSVDVPIADGIGYVQWSPLGNYVAFLVRDDSYSYLWAFSVKERRVFRVSETPVNHVVNFNGHSQTLEKPYNPSRYLWLPDETAIVFAAKVSRRGLIPSAWHNVTVPRVEDTRGVGYESPLSSTSRIGSQSAGVTSDIDLVFSRQLVIASLGQLGSKEKSVEFPSAITHILPGPSESKISVVTVAASSQGGVQRHVAVVDTENERVSADLVGERIPTTAHWNLYSGGKPNVVAIVFDEHNGHGCYKEITNTPSSARPPICLDSDVDEVEDATSHIVAVTVEGSVYLIDKGEFEEHRLSEFEQGVESIEILKPLSPACGSDWYPIVRVQFTPKAKKARRGESSLEGSVEVYRLNLRTSSVGKPIELDTASDNRKIVSRATCRGDLISVSESWLEPKNYKLHGAGHGGTLTLTDFSDPMPEFAAWRRVPLNYRRHDGLNLRADILLPPHRQRVAGNKYPAVVWQYPSLFESSMHWRSFWESGQTNVSSYRSNDTEGVFGRPTTAIYIGSWLPNLLALQGYAVVAYPDFPLVGRDGGVYGTFPEQAEENASALVQALDLTGLIDVDRIAIGGHSRGGTTATMLLARTDLFVAGFTYAGPSHFVSHLNGFQYEPRSYWDFADAYVWNSPIFYADSINEPLLSMYGERDHLPKVSQAHDLHDAIDGRHGVSRMIVFPEERHDPIYRETQNRILIEVSDWLEEYVAPLSTSK